AASAIVFPISYQATNEPRGTGRKMGPDGDAVLTAPARAQPRSPRAVAGPRAEASLAREWTRPGKKPGARVHLRRPAITPNHPRMLRRERRRPVRSEWQQQDRARMFLQTR